MQPRVSVIVCAYTMDRWDQLVRSVESVKSQTVPIDQIVLVIDHNQELLERSRAEIDDVRVVASGDPAGLSAARNTGIAHATGSIVAFLDDDARAESDWAAHILATFADPAVLGVGGLATADWIAPQPGWFPAEFNWVVGCSHEGLPETTAPVRNVIGCNMAFRREVFDEIGGFNPDMGRVGTHPVGCEETELCIRALQHWPGKRVIYQPAAEVIHEIPAARAHLRYFLHRCYAEGLSKARVVDLVGADRGLSSERNHALRVLPLGVARGVGDTLLRGRLAGLGRAAAIVAGLAATTAGFAIGSVRIRVGGKSSRTTQVAQAFEPILMSEVELAAPIERIHPGISSTGNPYRRAQVMVRLEGRPIGTTRIDLPDGGLLPETLATRIWDDLGDKVRRRLAALGLDLAGGLPIAGLEYTTASEVPAGNVRPISVIVATRDRPEALTRCLESLGGLDYPDFEIIVVDNAPTSGATKEIVTEIAATDPRVRYVFEPKAGLARAHNAGLTSVFNSIVAFTDDDVLVDSAWLSRIAAVFATSPAVDCVTGLIYPGELETAAQDAVESLSYGKGYESRSFNLVEHRVDSPLFPYAAGTFGSGANMAFRTEALEAFGGFDPVLGAGAPGAGGDDLAAFLDVISNGGTIVYEPAAIIYHFHDTGFERLKRQAYGYGVGLGAYLTRAIVQRPRRLLEFALRTPQGVLHFLRSGTAPESPGIPGGRTLALRRLIGVLNGPRAYLGGRRTALRASSHTPDPK